MSLNCKDPQRTLRLLSCLQYQVTPGYVEISVHFPPRQFQYLVWRKSVFKSETHFYAKAS